MNRIVMACVAGVLAACSTTVDCVATVGAGESRWTASVLGEDGSADVAWAENEGSGDPVATTLRVRRFRADRSDSGFIADMPLTPGAASARPAFTRLARLSSGDLAAAVLLETRFAPTFFEGRAGVVRWAPDGTERWQRALPGRDKEVQGLAPAPDDGLYVVVKTRTPFTWLGCTPSFSPNPQNSPRVSSAAFRLTASGACLWAKAIALERGADVEAESAVSQGDSLIVAGDGSLEMPPERPCWAVKLEPDGRTAWSYVNHEVNICTLDQLAATKDDVALAGHFLQGATFVSNAHDLNAAYAMHLAGDGTMRAPTLLDPSVPALGLPSGWWVDTVTSLSFAADGSLRAIANAGRTEGFPRHGDELSVLVSIAPDGTISRASGAPPGLGRPRAAVQVGGQWRYVSDRRGGHGSCGGTGPMLVEWAE